LDNTIKFQIIPLGNDDHHQASFCFLTHINSSRAFWGLMPFLAPKVMTQIEQLVIHEWDDAPTKGWQAAAQVGAQLALGRGWACWAPTRCAAAGVPMGRGQRPPPSLGTQHPSMPAPHTGQLVAAQPSCIAGEAAKVAVWWCPLPGHRGACVWVGPLQATDQAISIPFA